MTDTLFGGQGATLLTAIVIVAVALLALVGVFWLIRARASSTFIRGGKNRQPRLAVLDATAVDTRRRLVLIRRDDVEHLIMIGGPTDIVIESRIVHGDDGQSAPAARHAQPQKSEPRAERPVDRPERPMERAAPAAAQRPTAPVPPQPRRPEPEPRPEPSLARPTPPAPRPQPSPEPQPSPQPAARTAPAAAPAPATRPVGSIRDEASLALESARARVFEEPSFDEAAYDELTSAPAPQIRPAATPVSAAIAPATITAAATPSYTLQPAQPSRATGEPPQHTPAQRPVPGDFESVLAAELSEDLSLDISDGGYFEPLDDEPRQPDDQAVRSEAPEVEPDSQPSRDSLEAEMERLLGDLSRKP
tara:strand:- start:9746 stop:10831 length:1086 start_codon:yes stop_codon:yes gene_type:complete